MFWGGEKLATELVELISDFDANRIDGAAYRLSIGSEIYVSPTGEPHDPRDKPKTQLVEKQGFTIPAGQFGFWTMLWLLFLYEPATNFVVLLMSLDFTLIQDTRVA